RTSASGWRARCHDAAGLRWATRTAVPLPAAVGDVDEAVTGCGGGGGRGRHRLRWGRWTRPSPAAVGEVDEAVTGCGGGRGRGRRRVRWGRWTRPSPAAVGDVDEPRYRPRWATWMTTLRRTPSDTS